MKCADEELRPSDLADKARTVAEETARAAREEAESHIASSGGGVFRDTFEEGADQRFRDRHGSDRAGLGRCRIDHRQLEHLEAERVGSERVEAG